MAKTRDLAEIAFQGTNPRLRPAPAQLKQFPIIRNTAHENITAFWSATRDMDDETELSERIKTKKLSVDKKKYISDDNPSEEAGNRTSRHQDIHLKKIGLKAYESYQKALPAERIS